MQRRNCWECCGEPETKVVASHSTARLCARSPRHDGVINHFSSRSHPQNDFPCGVEHQEPSSYSGRTNERASEKTKHEARRTRFEFIARFSFSWGEPRDAMGGEGKAEENMLHCGDDESAEIRTLSLLFAHVI